MNTPLDHEPDDLRYAEYVLGVLDAETRAEIEREIASNPHAAAEVERWQEHLLPLVEDIPPETPPNRVWARIEDQLGWSPPLRHAPRSEPELRGWWNNLPLWRALTVAAGVVAAACIIALLFLPRGRFVNPAAPARSYMASTIIQNDGQVGWTATMDLQHARMVVVPAEPQALPADRTAELWLIPAGHKPIAVGMIRVDAPTMLQLDQNLANNIGPTAALAVSIEPSGGSSSGQPTGPVIGKGPISGT